MIKMDDKLTNLQRLSLDLLVKPSVENTQVFLSMIRDLDNVAVTEFQSCLLFPPLKILRQRQKIQQRIQETCINMLYEVLTRSNLTKWNTFRDIVGCVCVAAHDYMSGVPDGCNVDEVLAALVTETLSAAFRSLDKPLLSTVLRIPEVRAVVPVLWSNIIFQSVELMKKSSARRVRLACLHLLQDTMMEAIDDPDYRSFLGAQFANFLPGILTACLSMIRNTDAVPFVGQQVLMQAVDTCSSVLCLVYEDSQVPLLQKRTGDSETKQVKSPDLRSTAWLKDTIPKVTSALQSLSLIAADESSEIRQSLIDFSHRIVKSCSRTLKDCLASLIRMLLPLLEDSFPSVSLSAKDTLDVLRSAIADDSEAIWGVLQEDFVSTIESLPLVAKTQSEKSLAAALKISCGYCWLLDQRMRVLLSSGDVMERFTDVLVRVGELDYRHVSLMEYSTNHDPGQPFSYTSLCDRDAVALFHKLCHFLGRHSILDWFQHFLTLLSSPPDIPHLNGVISVANGIMGESWSSDKQTDGCAGSAAMLLQIYISSDVWSFSTSTQTAVLSRRCISGREDADSVHSQPASLTVYKQHVICVCLHLDSLVLLSRILGASSKSYLHSTLYLLLEKTVSDVPLIQNHAFKALTDISKLYGHQTLADFIHDNVNYVVSMIVIKIRQLHRHPKTVFVLQATLKLTAMEVLPSIWKIVTVILEQLDDHHGVAALPFMVVLGVVVDKVAEWQRTVAPSSPPVAPVDHIQNSVNYLLEGQNSTSEAEDDSKSTVEASEAPEDAGMEQEEVEPEVPQHVTSTVEILQRCAYLLPVEDRHLRSVVLDIVAKGCTILHSHQKQLLPVIHKIWTSIILLHRSSDLIILRKAFLCLLEMTSLAGSFLRYRVSNEIAPLVARFLGQESRRSCVTGITADDWNPSRRLLSTFLESFAPLLKSIDAEDSLYEIAATSVLPYLLPRQPEQLRELAVKFFRDVAVGHPDLVFVKILQSSDIADSFDSARLPSVKIPRRGEDCVSAADARRILVDLPAFQRLSQH